MDWQAVLTPTARVAATLLVVLLPSGRAAAQTRDPYKPPVAAQAAALKAATPDDLTAVELLIKGGQYEAALDAARALEPNEKVQRLRIDAALGLEKPGEALAEYDALVTLLDREVLPVLEPIAKLVVRQDLGTPDPLLVIDACVALLQRGPDPCGKALQKQADDAKTPFALRVATLAGLARASMPGAAIALETLAATAVGPQWRPVVDATALLPDGPAVRLLAAALQSEDEGVQFAAASALGRYRSAEARAALEQYLQGDRPGMPRGAARLSRARQGDDRWFREFAAVLPQLEGDMLLEMGLMLQERRDPRGVDAITRVASGPHDLLRLQAAALLPPSHDVATKVFTDSLRSENPYTRAAALDAFRDSSLLTVTAARRLLADSAPWVRVRAARVLFSRMESTAPARAAKRP